MKAVHLKFITPSIINYKYFRMKLKMTILLFSLLISSLAQAISFEACIGTSSAFFPYTPNFGVSGNIGAERAFWYDTSFTKESKYWSFTSVGGNGQLVPSITAGEDADYETPTLFSRCLSLKKTDELKLSFTLVTTGMNKTNHFKVWLAPKVNENHFLYDSRGNNNGTLLLDITPQSAGSYTYNIPISNIPADDLYGIAFQIVDCAWDGEIYIKDFSIEKVSDKDNAIGKLINPLSSCSLSANEKIQVQIKNNGTSVLESLKCHYQINDGTITSETFALRLGHGEDTILSFSKSVDVSALGEHKFKIWLEKEEQDPSTDNDTTLSIIRHYTHIYTPPYKENFETDSLNNKWNTISKKYNQGSSWFFTHENNNKSAHLQTDLDSVSDVLVSPCIKLEAFKTYQLKFSFKATNSSKEENLKVITGDNPHELSTTIWSLEKFTFTDYQTGSTYFTPTVSGTYYFGWEGYSTGFKAGVNIDNIEVTEVIPANVPYNQGFENKTAMDEISILDRNSDNTTWQIETSEENSYSSYKCLKIKASQSTNADDWVTFNPLRLEAHKKYTLIYSAKGYSSSKENFNVILHNTPHVNASSTLFNFPDSTMSSSYGLRNTTFEVASDGIYYLSFHATLTKKSSGSLFLDNVMVIDSSSIDDTLIKINAVSVPNGAITGSASERIGILYKNFSSRTLNNVNIFYKVNSSPHVMESFNIDAPYQAKEYNFTTPIDFSKGNRFTIKTWINYQGQEQVDTVYTTVDVLSPASTPYLINFENAEELTSWNFNDNWKLMNQAKEAFRGNGYAYSPTQDIAKDNFLVSRGIVLSKDTSYLLSFFYAQDSASSTSSSGSNISVLYSSIGQNPIFFIDTICRLQNFKNSNYKQHFNYFRVPSSGTYYVAFKSHSQGFAKGIKLDQIAFMDSLTSIKTALSLTKVHQPLSGSCDLDRNETVRIDIENNGYFNNSNVVVQYRFGNGILHTDTVKQTIISGNTISHTLQKPWIIEQPNKKDSLRVWLSMPYEIDRSDDTSSYIYFEKSAPNNLPLKYGFESSETDASWLVIDLNNDNNTWKFNNNPSQAHSGSSYASYTKQKDSQTANDWLITPCFNLEKSKVYELNLYYKAASSNTSEDLDVYLLHSLDLDNIPNARLLQSANNISNTNYNSLQKAFEVEKNGKYYLGIKAASTGSGRQIFIDDVSIALFDSIWDAGVTSIFNNYSSYDKKFTILDSNENLSVRVKNYGNVEIKNLPIVCEINDKITLVDTIPSIQQGQTIDYNFKQKLNLYFPDTYKIEVYTLFHKDTSTQNNGSQITLISSLPKVHIVNLINPSSGATDSNEIVKISYQYTDTLIDGKSIFDKTAFSLEVNGKDFQDGDPIVFSSNQESTYTFPLPVNLFKPGNYSIKITPTYRNRHLSHETEVFTVSCKGINVQIDSLLSPVSDILDSSELVKIRLVNHEEFELKNVIIRTKVNQQFFTLDTIAKIAAKDTMEYTLKKELNLHHPDKYELQIVPIYRNTELDEKGISKVIVSKAADLSINKILFPSTGIFDSNEIISCLLKNVGEYDVFDFSIGLEINFQTHQEELIPVLKSGDSLIYTFSKPCNFYAPGAYPIKVKITSGKDATPINNFMNITIYSEAPDVGILAISSPTNAPFSSAEEISITVKNWGKYDVENLNFVCSVNQNTQTGILSQLNVNESKTFTFPQPVDMSVNQDYIIKAHIHAAKDANRANDSLSKKFSKIFSIEGDEAPVLTIYPNPTKDVVHINYIYNIQSLELLDGNGKSVYQRNTNLGQTASISVAHLPKGAYILKIHTEKGIYSKTIILN